MMIISLICIFLTFFFFYLASNKKKMQWSYLPLHFLSHRPQLCRLFACGFYLLATVLLSQQYHVSIGFISFWVFASPILFLFILSVNPLTSNKGK